MNKVAVYIGYYRDNHESLFYKVDSDTYYDLKEKRKVSSREIYGLVSFTNTVECHGIPTKKNLIRCYNVDRMKKIKLDRIFIGNIYQITEIMSKTYFGNSLLTMSVNTKFRTSTLKENALLYVEDNVDLRYLHQATFLDLETEEKYKNSIFYQVGNFYIPSEKEDRLTLANIELGIYQTEIEKGKILERYRNWRNNK